MIPVHRKTFRNPSSKFRQIDVNFFSLVSAKGIYQERPRMLAPQKNSRTERTPNYEHDAQFEPVLRDSHRGGKLRQGVMLGNQLSTLVHRRETPSRSRIENPWPRPKNPLFFSEILLFVLFWLRPKKKEENNLF